VRAPPAHQRPHVFGDAGASASPSSTVTRAERVRAGPAVTAGSASCVAQRPAPGSVRSGFENDILRAKRRSLTLCSISKTRIARRLHPFISSKASCCRPSNDRYAELVPKFLYAADKFCVPRIFARFLEALLAHCQLQALLGVHLVLFSRGSRVRVMLCRVRAQRQIRVRSSQTGWG
jgi:hypothetical protein